MVRSSGDEDRTDIANAGGNESVPSVPANAIAIWQAMGVVVQSYFSEKSLRQRLLAGDTITTRFFIPVLIQRMVGEKTLTAKNPTNPLDIPISGVMFTQESMGNTPNVVEIQTAYGHNTGVVNSLVAVDTFYSGPSGVIHPIIRKKTDRLASFKTKTGITLNRINNPITLQSRPTLPTSLVNDLGNIARTIGITYNHPMDIEFVVKRDASNATIYLVQARPLIERKFAQAPNYLSDAFVASLSPQQLAKGQAIGVAGGFIRTITSADELIMRDELPQALNEYHDNPEREKIRAVIVTKMAPTTSHEATQFKGYALPVLVVSPESKAHVEQLLSKGSILIDTQRALIVSPEAQNPTIDQGWYAHPIAECTSIISHYMLPEGSEFRTRYASYIQQLSTKKKDDLTQTHRQLLDLIKKSPDKAVVTDALARIINRIAQQISSKGNNSPENDYLQLFLRAGGEQEQTLLDETQRILAHAIVCAAEILYTMDTLQTITPANRISYLYPIKFLEATILQQADPEIVDCYSYVLLRKMFKEDREAIKTIAAALPANAQEVEQTIGVKNLEYLVELEKMNVLGLREEIQQSWQAFIHNLTLVATPENRILIQKFATIISQLNDLNVLDLWINTSFVNDEAEDPLILCNNLMAEFEKNKDVITLINQKKSILAAWNNKIESWGDPSQFAALYKQFDEQFIQEFITGKSPEAQAAFKELMYSGANIAEFNDKKLTAFAQNYAPLIKLFNNAEPLGKLIILQFLRQIIDVYDHTIKGMTGSPLYKDKEVQVRNFAQLLVPYEALMEIMTTLIKDQESGLFFPSQEATTASFDDYLRHIRNFVMIDLIRQPTISSLQPSRGFSVSAAQIGSAVNIQRAKPESLEDLFTLAHQNMIITIAILNKKLGLETQLLPPFLERMAETLGSIVVSGVKTSLVGIDYHYPQITINFNMPLNNHSATMEVNYNKNKAGQAILLFKVFGHNEYNRMNSIVTLATLAGLASKIECASKPHSTASEAHEGYDVTQFAWIITPQTDLDEIAAYLKLFGETTFGGTDKSLGKLYKIEDIHPFIANNWSQLILTTMKDIYGGGFLSDDEFLETIDKDTLKKMFTQAFPVLTDEFFAQDITMTEWFIQSYIKAEMNEEALNLIIASLKKIIKGGRYTYSLHRGNAQSLWEFCIDKLRMMLKNPSMQEKAINAAIEILSPKNIDSLFMSPQLVDYKQDKAAKALITLALELHALTATMPTLHTKSREIVEYILQSPHTAVFFADLDHKDELNHLIAAVQDENTNVAAQFNLNFYHNLIKNVESKTISIKTGYDTIMNSFNEGKLPQDATFKENFYKTFYELLLSHLEKKAMAKLREADKDSYLEGELIGDAKNIAKEFIKDGQAYPGNYEYAQQIALQLRNSILDEGNEYMAIIAGELIKSGKNDLAQPIVAFLQTKIAALEETIKQQEDELARLKEKEALEEQPQGGSRRRRLKPSHQVETALENNTAALEALKKELGLNQ
jgi:hypothetical protein